MPALRLIAGRLHRFAEGVAGVLLAVIFVAFIIQIVFRYAFNLPVGWTSELSVVAWLWLVLWGAAFVLKEDDEIRLDLLSGGAGRRARLVMGGICAIAIITLYGMSMPAAYSYVSFMKVESTSYLKIRFDWLFSIYLVFALAVIVRYLWLLWQLLRNRQPPAADPAQTGSAL